VEPDRGEKQQKTVAKKRGITINSSVKRKSGDRIQKTKKDGTDSLLRPKAPLKAERTSTHDERDHIWSDVLKARKFARGDIGRENYTVANTHSGIKK